MAKRLRMTNADYVAIAISPALIMALVGSLVFFLIEVSYAGDYQARLNYVFALFVFAAVLIARISIEMGSERAAAFGLVLGIATFLVLQKFVEHPSVLSPLINLALIATVWWCAHKLTWDCTLIDDNEDASGEGLLQRIGADGPEPPTTPPTAAHSNELVTEEIEQRLRAPRWWSRFATANKGPHTPGLWVLYFSLAALPLFGVGQHWIPAGEIGRRRYAFGLLAVYVFSALALLVTTSFLGLRRYLRQRNLEMPGPMAGTWVTIGAALIAIVMFVAALLPRPGAEIAISQAPWQVGSPQGLSSSRSGEGSDGVKEPEGPGEVVSNKEDAPRGDAVRDGQASQTTERGGSGEDGAEEGKRQSSEQQNGSSPSRPSDDAGGNSASNEGQSNGEPPGNGRSSEPRDSQAADAQRSPEGGGERKSSDPPTNDEQRTAADNQTAGNTEGEEASDSESRFRIEMLEHDGASDLTAVPRQVMSSLGGLVGLLKLLFYVIAAAMFVYFVWKNWQRIAQAIADILKGIRAFLAALLGGGQKAADPTHVKDAAGAVKRRTFAEFRDPFSSGLDRRASPEDVVRYTFEAFEAWAGDRGSPRSADQTPQELVRAAVAPQTPLHAAARRMVGVYSALAYAGGTSSREDVESLRELWRLLAAER